MKGQISFKLLPPRKKSLGQRLSGLFTMAHWDQAFLPKWLVQMGWSAHDNALRGKITGKSVLLCHLYRRGSFKLATGGTSGGVWADPPVGPPCVRWKITGNKFGKYTWAWLAAMQRDKGLNNEGSTGSDRMEARSDIGGTGTVTDRHGCRHKYPDNKWGGPPR